MPRRADLFHVNSRLNEFIISPTIDSTSAVVKAIAFDQVAKSIFGSTPSVENITITFLDEEECSVGVLGLSGPWIYILNGKTSPA